MHPELNILIYESHDVADRRPNNRCLNFCTVAECVKGNTLKNNDIIWQKWTNCPGQSSSTGTDRNWWTEKSQQKWYALQRIMSRRSFRNILHHKHKQNLPPINQLINQLSCLMFTHNQPSETECGFACFYCSIWYVNRIYSEFIYIHSKEEFCCVYLIPL